MAAQAQLTDMPAQAQSHFPWREVSAASIGNALEFYDLVIYGYFAVVISKLFFPAANETVSLMLAVGTFGISFLMRPLGAMVLASTQGISTLFAASIAALLSYLLTPEQVSDWGWRSAFAVGLLIGPVGYYLRSQVAETPEFRNIAANDIEKSPVCTVLRRDWFELLLGVGVVAGSTAFNYVHKVYMPTYALTQLHFPPVSAYLGAAVTGLFQAITGPMFGALSDRVGRHRVLWVAFPLVCVTTYPMFLILNTWPTVATLVAVQALVGLLNGACLAPITALLAEIFPTGTRSTGLALSYNLSVTLFGGFAPLIATSLIAATGDKLTPSYYVMGSSLLSIAAIVALTHVGNAARRIRAAEPG
jgi:MFS transporter, MHS family, proline/betaine transporter